MALWALRLIAPRKGTALDPSSRRVLGDDDVRTLVGLAPRTGSAADTAERLIARLREVEQGPISYDAPVFRNVGLLGDCVGLGAVEREVLAFAACAAAEEGLSVCLRVLPVTMGHDALCQMIAGAIGHPHADVRSALDPQATLRSTGLVVVGPPAMPRAVHTRLRVLEGLDQLLLREHEGAASLTRSFFRVADPARLVTADFPHLVAPIGLVVRYLGRALDAGHKGVNVLVHGGPGTGKTELCRAIAREVGAEAYEVRDEDDDGDAISDERRMAAYRLCQRLVSNARRAVVVFDEIEDVFPRQVMGLTGLRHASGGGKAHLNRMLEQNPVPTLWIGNRIDQIDPAYLRRFDYVLELLPPPKAVRRRILDAHTSDLALGSACLDDLARDDRLVPGHIERAAKVARTIGPTSEADGEGILRGVIDAALAAAGVPAQRSRSAGVITYDLGFLNASEDVGTVVAALGRRRAGTVCLHGPSGTGKTAFAEHVADRLGMPVAMRRASDLLDPFVGGTEANIARMFREAKAERAVLLLDEADSFLMARTRAQRTWEVTLVNELLVQMESFDGIFICTTNLMDAVDAAAMRRFLFKVRFDPLRPAQREALLQNVAAELGAPVDPAAHAAAARRLASLDGITVGDFAVVARRFRATGAAPTFASLVAAIEEEWRLKPEARRTRVGFGRGDS